MKKKNKTEKSSNFTFLPCLSSNEFYSIHPKHLSVAVCINNDSLTDFYK